MNPIVESYLLGELKGDELRQFEAALAANPDLRKEVEEYGKIIRDLERTALLNKIKAAGEIVKTRDRRKLKRRRLSVILLALALVIAIAVRTCQTRTHIQNSVPLVQPIDTTPPLKTDTTTKSGSRFQPNRILEPSGKKQDQTPVSTDNKPIAGNPKTNGSETSRNFRSVSPTSQQTGTLKAVIPDSLFITPAFQALKWNHPVYSPLAVLFDQKGFNYSGPCLPQPPKGAAPSDSLALIKAACFLAKKEMPDATYWFSRITGSPAFHTEALWGIAWCSILGKDDAKARKYLKDVVATKDAVFAPRAKTILAIWKD